MKRGWVSARQIAVAIGFAGSMSALLSCGGGGSVAGAGPSVTKAQLGRALFFDKTLSNPAGMSCATCHSPTKAFTDPRPGFPTSQGVIKGLFGFRKAPSIMYMAFSPEFAAGTGEGGLSATGGQFWDGRAADLPSQAKFPLVNPVEMNNPSLQAVVTTVMHGPEAVGLKQVYGAGIFNNPENAINAIVDALAAFEKTPEISPFSSKYDAFLAGKAELTPAELRGLSAFNGKGGCSGCHTDSPAADGTPALFTNFCYANLGLPKNPANPYYTLPAKFNPLGSSFIDIGLEVATGKALDAGNFMTPPLRNVALKAPYFHNGIFKTLAEVVNFYNTRDLGGFPAAEIPQTEDKTELGNLQLTAQEQADIVTFLGTLTDGYTATPSYVVPRFSAKGASP
jgi:cytochrome c peroxidase